MSIAFHTGYAYSRVEVLRALGVPINGPDGTRKSRPDRNCPFYGTSSYVKVRHFWRPGEHVHCVFVTKSGGGIGGQAQRTWEEDARVALPGGDMEIFWHPHKTFKASDMHGARVRVFWRDTAVLKGKTRPYLYQGQTEPFHQVDDYDGHVLCWLVRNDDKP